MYSKLPVRKIAPIHAISVSSCRFLHQMSLENLERHNPQEYQPIVSMEREDQKKYQRQFYYDTIKALPTVEQKLYEISQFHRPKQLRYLIPALAKSYNGIFFQRYITRTHLINHLPENFSLMDVDKEYTEVSDVFKQTVSSFYKNDWKSSDLNYQDYLCNKRDCSKLLNLLILQCFKKLALKNDYILESTIQQNPRINSYWFHNGFHSEKNKIYQENLTFQFRDTPAFTIRIKKPLNAILKLEDPLCATAEVPDYNFHPKALGFAADRKWITSVPGHWFDDPCDSPFLLVKTTDDFHKLLSKLQFHDLEKIKESTAITSSFGWLNAAATYHGFTPYHDLTYPFVCHTIITNGQDWNFFVYQLNTIAFHIDVDKKDRRNICWSSGTIRLFDTIENGEIKGLNDEVFKILLKFLMNAPVSDENIKLKPYLGEDNRTEEEIDNMRYIYRNMYSHRPHPNAHKHEVPTWHRIYLPKYNKLAKPLPFTKLY
ncbi:large ribosomal subunit protein mL65 [Parasteatoda tepidariorum]|uniref:large ribosomal subunit protein mL65 n=1 Tax=Parasteatoda tepidariorum TaxID=114398 RepID=UPI00077FB1F1|nr:28S ribosomal protein S30, mitochondrial [Parasteatoda tepidariorum]